ncbi:MAG TPA: MauE/DoxX family redox-associated membrane protein [Pyrinomonadaceae bacterium]|nr:MauE/DoxX family redox-associated membrane protein [Pyrinomonadaceae bacterium]
MNELDARAGGEGRGSKDVRLLKAALAPALLCGFALSRRLWVYSPGRLYPAVPVFDFLPRVAPAVGYVWLVALVALLVLVAVRPRPRAHAAAFVALASLYVLFDESRLQPWFYQYLFMTAALAAYSWRDGEDAREPLRACALVVACVYFWSGVQKLNPQFFAEVLPSLAAPYLARLPASFARLLTPLGALVPLTEICAGLMLLTRRWRRAGVVLALITHAVVLLLFVPFRRNNVIWPWNAATAAFVLILFRRGADGPRDFLPRRALSLQTAALVLFGVMPALSLFGLWGQYLSSALYSGNVARAEFALGERVGGKLPPRVRSKLRPAQDGFRLDLGHWSYAELNVPAFPSAKVRGRAAATLCEFAESPADVRLEVSEPPRFFGGETRTTAFDCDTLQAGQYPPR